jgi:single-stranded DNA-binding protein
VKSTFQLTFNASLNIDFQRSRVTLDGASLSFGDNIFVEGTLQTRKFTPRDGSQRTVYEVVSRSDHQTAVR